jgi:hypothetical protein
MNNTEGTKTLTELLVRERLLADERKQAIETHKRVLGELNDPLKKRFGLYCEKFQPLLDQANALGQKIVEIHAEGFGERNIEWGNGGIITLQVDGEFTRIFTKDMFCGEYDEFAVYIPTKYLEEDGEQRLLDDAQRLEAELKVAQTALDEANRQKKENLEYAEFVRLQAKFSDHLLS